MAIRGAFGVLIALLGILVCTLVVEAQIGNDYICVKSCQDKGNYIRSKAAPNGQPMCVGNSSACSWYTDNACTKLTFDSIPPLSPNSGIVCGNTDSGWCRAAYWSVNLKNPPTVTCDETGAWTCIRSCLDKGNYIRARNRGIVYNNGFVQCLGPDNSRCSWYSDGQCSTLAPNELPPNPNLAEGQSCPNPPPTSNWCKTAYDNVFYGITSTCTGLTTTTTTTATTTTATTTTALTTTTTTTSSAAATTSSTGTTTTTTVSTGASTATISSTAASSSSASGTATATGNPTFAPLPTAPALPSNAGAIDVPNNSNVQIITSNNGGITCTGTGCTMSPTSTGSYKAVCPSGSSTCNVMKVVNTANSNACLAVQGTALLETTCPANTRRALLARRSFMDWLLLRKRQSPTQTLPWWTFYQTNATSASSTKKLINSNMNTATGCLLVPSGSGAVNVGSCDDPASGAWAYEVQGSVPTPPPPPPPPSPSSTNVGAIVGGVVGGVAGLALIGGLTYYGVKKSKEEKQPIVVMAPTENEMKPMSTISATKPAAAPGGVYGVDNYAQYSPGPPGPPSASAASASGSFSTSMAPSSATSTMPPATVGMAAGSAAAISAATTSGMLGTAVSPTPPPNYISPASVPTPAPAPPYVSSTLNSTTSSIPTTTTASDFISPTPTPIYMDAPAEHQFPQSNKPELTSMVGRKCYTLRPFVGSADDELSLDAGDVVMVKTSHDDGWGLVRRITPEKEELEGMVPLNFLSPI